MSDYKDAVVTETVTRKALKPLVDSDGPGGAFISVNPDRAVGTVDLVIGAKWVNRDSMRFSKNSLKELIDFLVDVHEAEW